MGHQALLLVGDLHRQAGGAAPEVYQFRTGGEAVADGRRPQVADIEVDRGRRLTGREQWPGEETGRVSQGGEQSAMHLAAISSGVAHRL